MPIVVKITIKPEKFNQLQDNLLMFFVGNTRKTGNILSKQNSNMKSGKQYREYMKKIVSLAQDLKSELNQSNIECLGSILHSNWMYKKEMASGITNELINSYYEKAIQNGAVGGKLLGAGGGGFLLFCVEQKNQGQLRNALSDLVEVDFKFDQLGSSIIYNN